MLAMALKPFGVRSLVGLMKLPAALLTRPGERPGFVPDALHHRVHRLRVADVDGVRPDRSAVLVRQFLRRRIQNRAAPAGDPDLGAELQVPGGDFLAQARCRRR